MTLKPEARSLKARTKRVRPPSTVLAAIISLAALPPLLFGTVHLPAMVVVGVLCLVVALCGLHASRERGVPLSPLGLAAALLGLGALCQLIPIPESLLAFLSPQNAGGRQALRELGLSGVEAGGRVSLAPSNTALAAFRWLALATASLGVAALFGARRRQTRPLVSTLAMTLAATGVIQVALGLIQTLFGQEGVMLWLFETTRASNTLVSGTFINGNHGAAFMALAALCACGLAAEHTPTRPRVMWAAAAVVCATGAVLSASRGGITALLLAGFGFAVHAGGRALLTPDKTRSHGPAGARIMPWIAVGLLPLGLAMAIVTQGALTERFAWELQTSTSLEEVGDETKIQMIKAAARMIAEFPLAGIGADAFGAVAPAWLTEAPTARFAFVESDAIEIVLSFGLLLGGLALALCLLAQWRITAPSRSESKRRMNLTAVGIGYGLVAWIITSAVSFNVEILGLALPALICAEGLLALRRRAPLWTLNRPAAGALIALLTLLSALGLALHLSTAPRQARLAQALKQGDPIDPDTLSDTLSLTPLDGHALAQAALWRDAHEPQGDPLTLALAQRARTLAPAYPSGHLAAARVHAKLGQTDEAASAYRQAMERLRPVPTALVKELLAALPEPSQRAEAIPPRHDAIRTLMLTLIQDKRHIAALNLGVELQTRHPKSAAAHYFTARAALASDQALLAELYARHMIDAFPDDANSYFATADALIAQKRHRAALPILTAGVERLPDDPHLRLERVELLLSLPMDAIPGRDGLIKADLESLRVTSIANKHTRAHFFFLSGVRWEQLGRSDRAKVDFTRAAELRPEVAGYRKKADL